MKTQKLILCMALVTVVCICGLPETAWGLWILPETIAAGDTHTIGLKADGTVVGCGTSANGQLNIGSWSNIVQVVANQRHSVGLKSDGTVVACGNNAYGQLNVGGWTNIVQVASCDTHSVGLISNGTVVGVGYNGQGGLNIGGWTDIVQVAVGRGGHTVGLKSNGTVVATGLNNWGQCNVGGWTNIVQIAAGALHTLGLKADGTVVGCGTNANGQLNIGSWSNIVQIDADDTHSAGVRSNGTAVAAGNNAFGQCDVGGWTNIVQITTGQRVTLGIKADGTAVGAGYNIYGQLNVGGWALNVPAGFSFYPSSSISGYIRQYNPDGSSTPIAGNNVIIAGNLFLETSDSRPMHRPSSVSSRVVTTDGNGYYTLDVYTADNAVISTQYSDYNITPYNAGDIIGDRAVDFGLYTIDGYVRRNITLEGINSVNVTVTGGSPDINLTTADKTPGDPGYYEAHVGHSGSRQYTVTPSNP